jgi:hypothetical protein
MIMRCAVLEAFGEPVSFSASASWLQSRLEQLLLQALALHLQQVDLKLSRWIHHWLAKITMKILEEYGKALLSAAPAGLSDWQFSGRTHQEAMISGPRNGVAADPFCRFWTGLFFFAYPPCPTHQEAIAMISGPATEPLHRFVFQIAYPLISNSVAEAYQEGLSEPFWLLENNIAVVSLEPKDPG